VDLARAYLEGGAPCLQLRAKDLASGPFLGLCDAVVSLARSFGALVIVNDRVDLALVACADGVHVGVDDLPPSVARALLGPQAIVGLSTHTRAQIERGVAEPVSYIAVGPVFGTETKHTGYGAVGLGLVAEGVERAKGCPVVGIGGVTLDRVPAVLAAGAAGVAVISDLLTGGDPTARTAAYVRALPTAPPR